MNNLIELIAADLKVEPYIGEPNESYEYRVLFSALGLWCLKFAMSDNCNSVGISKHAQSMQMHKLLNRYIELSPSSRAFLVGSNAVDIGVFIRNIYEQTGYLLTNDNNENILNNSGETVVLSQKDYLYLGIPENRFTINGLGIHCDDGVVNIEVRDFLVRDELTVEEYLHANFDECDFQKKPVDIEELEYFNPLYYGNTASAWCKDIKTKFTIARKSQIGPYYKIIKKDDETILFANQETSMSVDSLTGSEFRRIYVALKKEYDCPMQFLICPIDENYSYMRILGNLPNREYYYLLMNAWPKTAYSDRKQFIIRNNLIENVGNVLEKIGFVKRMGDFYG